MNISPETINTIEFIRLDNTKAETLLDTCRQIGELMERMDMSAIGIIFQNPDGEVDREEDLSVKRIVEILSHSPIPVLAAISGKCSAIQSEIAFACHFRIASSSTCFTVTKALKTGWDRIGGSRNNKLKFLKTYQVIDATEALSYGLIDSVADQNQIVAEAMRFLKSLVSGLSPHIVRAAVESINNSIFLPRLDALRCEAELFVGLATRVGRP